MLRELDTSDNLILVTRHNDVVAAIIPAKLPQLLNLWFQRNESQARAVEHSLRNLDDALAVEDVLGATSRSVTDRPASQDDPGASIEAVGVRELSQATGSILRAVEQGRVVLIRRHANVVGVLVPFTLRDLLTVRLDRDVDYASDIREAAEKPESNDNVLTVPEFIESIRGQIPPGIRFTVD